MNQDQQQDHGDNHDVGLETLVSKANRQVAQAARAHHTGHGGVGHQGNGGNGDGREDTRTGFWQQGIHDDLASGGAHRLGCLDDAAVDLAQGGFHQAGKERRSTDHQRRDGPGDT
ncbi:hypothetical protein D3C77_627270 [compost metagenome]